MKIKYIKDDSGVFSNFLRTIDWLWLKNYVDFDLEIDWSYNGKNLFDNILTLNLEKTDRIPEIETSSWVELVIRKTDLENDPGTHARRSSLPFYTDFEMNGCIGYFYTTPDIYFHKDFKVLRAEFNKIINKYIEFNSSFIQDNLCFNPDLKTLAVHLRYPNHYCHDRHNGALFNHDNFFEQNSIFVQEVFEKESFDQVYIACDSLEFIHQIMTRIPNDKVFYHKYDRGDSNLDWTQKRRPMDDEVKNMFIDFINLKHCSHSIVSTSNVAFGLLCHNTNMTFEMFPMLRNLHGM
jgi:hypothetical protein